MSKNHHKVDKAMEQQSDDFKLINGINKRIENRLRKSGIETYAQLASMTPKELISKLGEGKEYSVATIQEENWIGQARLLVPVKTQSKTRRNERHQPRNKPRHPSSPASAEPLNSEGNKSDKPSGHQHYENFTLELLLDEKNTTRRARVVHVQSGDSDTWAKWESNQIIDFIARHSGVHQTPLKSLTVPTIEKDPAKSQNVLEKSSKMKSEFSIPPFVKKSQEEISTPASSQPRLTPKNATLITNVNPKKDAEQVSTEVLEDLAGKIQSLGFKIFRRDTDLPMRNIPHDQAFNVCLTLDLNKSSLPETSQLDVFTIIYAKQLGSSKRQILRETQEVKPFEKILTLTVNNFTLSRGMYRLDALITIRTEELTTVRQPALKLFLESNSLLVY